MGDIARKLGMERPYISGIVHLVDHEEAALIAAVEGGKLRISAAVEIANGKDREISDTLAEAYESGQLRGHKLAAARRLIAIRFLLLVGLSPIRKLPAEYQTEKLSIKRLFPVCRWYARKSEISRVPALGAAPAI
jgi:hypothetical protein